jgi:hypothetical protein
VSALRSVQNHQKGYSSQQYNERDQKVAIGSNRLYPFTKAQVDLRVQRYPFLSRYARFTL